MTLAKTSSMAIILVPGMSGLRPKQQVRGSQQFRPLPPEVIVPFSQGEEIVIEDIRKQASNNLSCSEVKAN